MEKWLLLLVLSLTSFNIHAEPLPAAEVFKVAVKKIDPNTFAVNWDIKPNYFLYSDRIKLVTINEDNFHLGRILFPSPLTKTDKQDHTYAVYRNQLSVPISLLGVKSGEALLDLHYQGCADDGFCYPPEVRQIKIAIGSNLELSQVNIESDTSPPATRPIEMQVQGKNQNDIAAIFSNNNWFMIFFIFFGFGLLLSFTPCILPMVPVLSGIIVGHGEAATTKKAFFLSLSYVVSMSLTYAVIGAVVALLGANLQISLQSPWVISAFSLIFILLALSMFGFYEFRLPQKWQSKIAGSGQNQRGGHYWGAAIMGSLSTLILSPCVTAPLIGVLTYIAQSGNVLLGSLTLFFLSLGMGTPLLLIGTSAGKWLPNAGSWMNAVKGFFGVLLLAVAIYLMSRILPMSFVMVLWATLFIFSGIYSGALTHSSTNSEKFGQGIGIILLSYGLLILIGGSMGGVDPIQPLTAIHAASPVQEVKQVQTLITVQQAIEQARGKPVMLDFYADWCTSCKAMDATTFKDPQVRQLLSRFAVIKIDITANNADDKELMKEFNVIAPPTFIFFSAQGQRLDQFKTVGEVPADEFLPVLQAIN